jgi:hypothetical protein
VQTALQRLRTGNGIVDSSLLVSAAHVRSVEQGGTTVLLSLKSLKYFTLHGTATTAWRLFEQGSSAPAVATQIQRNHGVSYAAALADTSKLIETLRVNSLIVKATDTTERKTAIASPTMSCQSAISQPVNWQSRRVPSVATCFARLAIVHVMLVSLGFRRTLALCARPNKTYAPLTTTQISQLSRNMSHAVMLYPFGAKCLAHSLCTLSLLQKAGGTGSLQIGVNLFPFSAHAWVEYDGRPLCHNDEYLRQFARFGSIEPASL